MKFYHGSRNPNLKELNLEHYSGKIYLTDKYELAFMYAASPLRFWNFDREIDMVTFREIAKNGFKTQFQGKKAYIYTCEIEEFEKDEKNISGHNYKVYKPVKLQGSPEIIDDCYEKLISLEKQGRVCLERWEDKTDDEQKEAQRKIIEAFSPFMEKDRIEHPEEYKLIITLLPELEIKEEKI